jgi:signal peptidase I
VFLGHILPGLGHSYLRLWAFGALFLVATVIGSALLRDTGILRVLYNGVLYGVVSYHGYVLAPVRRETSRRAIWIFILGLAFVEMVVHIPASVLDDWKIEQYRVVGNSMTPLLQAGDRVLVARVRLNEIKRGDVVVFARTDHPTWQWAKRVLAVGGESLEIRDGRLYASGMLVDESHFRNIQSLDETEHVNRREVIHVPEGSLFVVGDNAGSSVDSRHYGPILVVNVIGVPYKIFWPIDHIRIIQPMAESVAAIW